MSYYIEFVYLKDGGTELTSIFIRSSSSFQDACNKILAEYPTATNFINKTI